MAFKSSSRNGARVIWIAVHTAEGATTAASLKAYFDRASTQASSHAIADDNVLWEALVPYDRASWTLRNGNSRSDNLEITGFAKWSRADWLNHMGMLRNTAQWIRNRCLARGIPMVKLSPADVRAGRAGVIGHVDYTNGTGDGTHWDPGPNFPWDIVMDLARGGTPNPGPGKPTTIQEELVAQANAGKGQISIPTNGARSLFVLIGGKGAKVTGHIYYIGDTPPGTGARYLGDRAVNFDADRPGPVGLPEGVRGITFFYDATAPFAAWCA